jgi:hypothetical protein
MDTRSPWGPSTAPPQYALAVSLIFTKATNQTIILNTPPDHVLSTSILWASLAHDKRFEQVPMNEAAPGDIIIGPGWRQGADGYAGIVVDHGRIVSNSSQGVRDDSSLLELQRSHPDMTAFRYVGFWNYYRSKSLANAGFNADEPRLPAGQKGGGQWTASEAPPRQGVSDSFPLSASILLGDHASNPDKAKVPLEKNSSKTYSPRFLRVMQFFFKWEGGYDDDPDDSGGETKFGIDKRSHPNLDIKNLTRDQAMQIYWEDWLKYGCDQYPWPQGEVLFNTYENGGKGLVQKILKRLGPNWTADEFLDELEAFYRRHVLVVKKDKKYLQGWLNRTEDLRKLIHANVNNS